AWPQRLPDLYQGEPLLVSVKIDGKLPPHSRIRIHGQQAEQPWSREIVVTPTSTKQATAGISVRWARSKIEALLDDKTRGRHAEQVRADLWQLALRHRLRSPFSSFVAVEDQVGRPAPEALARARGPNLLPRGETLQAISYPRTPP